MRGDAGDHDGAGAGESVVGEGDEDVVWFADRVEIEVGALASELHDAVEARVQSGGFEVVKVVGGFGVHEASVRFRVYMVIIAFPAEICGFM